MKTYLVSVEPKSLSAVVVNLQQQHVTIKQQLDSIGTLVISCAEEQKTQVEAIPGVLAVEEEGTSFAI